MSSVSVLVIGAGIGGITAAAHLARRGLRVRVLDKNTNPGGRCDQFCREGHRFDSGPTLFVMPHLYEEEFQALGTSMQAMLDLQRVDPTYHLVFDDGSQIALSSDLQSMQEQLDAIEPGSFEGFLRYLEEGSRHYRISMEKLVKRPFRRAGEFINLSNLPLLFSVKPFFNHYRHMAVYVTNPRLKSAFTFQDVYMGLSPFEAPATFSLVPYCEHAHGVWYPKGGMYQVVEALMKLARDAGVQFEFDATVEKIIVDDKRAHGVLINDGRQLKADVILANADLPYVYRELLPPNRMAIRLMRKEYSCSVISFFWGLDKIYPVLGAHTLFLADDYRDNFVSINRDLDLPANPSLYVHAPTRLDPSMAPLGQDTLIAIVPTGHMRVDNNQDWGRLLIDARQHVLRRLKTLGITDIEDHIKFETAYTPPSWANHYNLVNGSTHGLSHKLTQLAYFRPHNRHARYHNLYFAGASTHPGTGMPTAMVSGRLAAERIMDELPARGV